ncbi:MAG: hypothetical protein ACRD2C_12105 [Acidimicrobiales bacterium]
MASANPDKLDDAAVAVPVEVRNALAAAVGQHGLAERIAAFNRASQQPDRLTVQPDLHTGPLSAAVATGNTIDSRLTQVARAFRSAGERYVGPAGPGYPAAGLYVLPESNLASMLGSFMPQFRAADGGYEVRGPDGQWYLVRTVPPPGAPALARTESTVDLGNPHLWLGIAVAGQIGLSGSALDPPFRSAPPEAYDYVHFGENGIPQVGPDVAGQDEPMPDAPPGLWEPENALREGAKQADARHMGVHRTQASYYVDPQTGDRVAVVDAATIRYSNETDAAHVSWGRLGSDPQGRPTVVPTPDEDCGVGSAGQPTVRTANPMRVPLEGGGD